MGEAANAGTQRRTARQASPCRRSIYVLVRVPIACSLLPTFGSLPDPAAYLFKPARLKSCSRSHLGVQGGCSRCPTLSLVYDGVDSSQTPSNGIWKVDPTGMRVFDGMGHGSRVLLERESRFHSHLYVVVVSTLSWSLLFFCERVFLIPKYMFEGTFRTNGN